MKYLKYAYIIKNEVHKTFLRPRVGVIVMNTFNFKPV